MGVRQNSVACPGPSSPTQLVLHTDSTVHLDAGWLGLGSEGTLAHCLAELVLTCPRLHPNLWLTTPTSDIENKEKEETFQVDLKALRAMTAPERHSTLLRVCCEYWAGC